MWDIVWVTPQEHRSVSKSPFFSAGTAVSTFCAKTVKQRPLLPREVETGLQGPVDLYRTTVIFVDLNKSLLIPARLQVNIDLYRITVIFIDHSKSRLIPASLDWSQRVSIDPSKTTNSYWSLQDNSDLHQSQQVSTDPSKSLLICTWL